MFRHFLSSLSEGDDQGSWKRSERSGWHTYFLHQSLCLQEVFFLFTMPGTLGVGRRWWCAFLTMRHLQPFWPIYYRHEWREAPFIGPHALLLMFIKHFFFLRGGGGVYLRHSLCYGYPVPVHIKYNAPWELCMGNWLTWYFVCLEPVELTHIQ